MRNLYIRDGKIADMLSGIRKGCADDLERIMAWADETASGMITHRAHYEMEKCRVPVPFSDSIWNEVPKEIGNRDPEWLYALNRHSILLNLAKAFAFTGEIRYRNTFINLLDSYLSNTAYSEKFLNTSWRSLETGIRPENWIRSIELFSACDAPLPEDLISRMEESLREHIRQLKETHRAFHRLSNWGVIQDHGLFIAGAALNDDEAVTIALSRLEEEAVNETLEDGEHWEQSPLYHLEVLHSFLDTILVARRLGITVPEIIVSRSEMLSRALYEMTLEGGSIIPTGDSDEINADDLIYLAAHLFGLPFRTEKREENWWDLGEKEAPAGTMRRESILHGASGNVFLRGDVLTVHMISGLMGSGHGHISPLHVDIAIGGKVMITDAGRYTYTETEERKRLKDALSHNIFTIDEGFPEEAIGSWGYDRICDKEITKAVFRNGYDAAEGIYYGYLSSGIITRRKTVRIKDDLVVVIDEIIGDETAEHDYTAHWHLHPEAVISGDMVSIGGESLGISSTAGSPEIRDYRYSREYNELESAKELVFSARVRGMGSVVTVFSRGEEARIRKLETRLLDAGRILKDTEAVALSIEKGGREWIVLSRSHEITAQVDIMKAGFMEGYGRLLIMEKGDSYPTRLI